MSKAQARSVMKTLVNDCVDCRTGEVNTTQLAENTAHALNRDEWLDDEAHFIWDLAVEVSEQHRKIAETKRS